MLFRSLEHSQTLAESMDPLAFAYPVIYAPKSTTHIQPSLSSAFSISSLPSTTSVQLDKDGDSDRSEEKAETLIPESRKVKIFLEASRAGTPVYTRLGFHPISETTIEYKDEELLFPVMLWEGTIAGTK